MGGVGGYPGNVVEGGGEVHAAEAGFDCAGHCFRLEGGLWWGVRWGLEGVGIG